MSAKVPPARPYDPSKNLRDKEFVVGALWDCFKHQDLKLAMEIFSAAIEAHAEIAAMDECAARWQAEYAETFDLLQVERAYGQVLYEKAQKLAEALSRGRGQWYPSVNREICLKALAEWEA